MAKLLRKVKQNRWFKTDAQTLLDSGDVPSDPLGDLNTSQSKLSVFQVDENLGNIERIARALALGSQRIDNVGFVLFDASLLDQASIGLDSTDGETMDAVVNKCHRDLTNLTGNKLVALTRLILVEGDSDTILKKRIEELILEGIRLKELPEKARDKFPKKT
jgi:tRNA(Leu) C34 or U34 (ribose-2'-O)-methylase TrmL